MSARQVNGDPGLRMVASLCGNGSCPTVYSSNRGTMIVQGYAVSAQGTGIELPDGELLVEIPENILLAAAQHYLEQSTGQ